jgi:probable F420-dependent oxidoreductase
MYELFSALTAAAATTERIPLGSSICIVPQRDPIWLAKQVATIDQLSGGRFQFGVGYGWNREEFEDHGGDFRDRRARLHENIMAMTAIWTQDEPSFGGANVRFPSMWSAPKPVQHPHPPIVMGAEAGPRTAAHIAELCAGWMPVGGPQLGAVLRRGFDELKRAFDDRQRALDTLEVSVFAIKPDRGVFDKVEAMGVHRCLIWLPQGPRDEVLAALDRYGALL